MKSYVSKQWFECRGRIVTCKTELDGFATEWSAFLYDDMRKNLAMLNEMLARGKKEVLEHIERRESVVDYGQWLKQNPYIVSDFTPKSKRIQPKIEKVIFHSPATIVFWSDGDKTVVKATNELFDREKGLAMAISKKFLGNKGNYFNTFRKFIEEEE